MSTILKTGPAPHIRTAETVESVMYDVIIALIPAFAMAVYTFGVRALILTAVSVLTCILTEYLCQKALKRDIEAFDGSAILTGDIIFICSSCYYAFTICSSWKYSGNSIRKNGLWWFRT